MGEFYGATCRQIEAAAFAFAEVEDFVNGQVPKHTHESAHFLYVVRGEYEASVKEKKRLCHSSTMLYYPAGTTHSDHFYSQGGKFLTVSLTLEANKRMVEEINFLDYAVAFNDVEISWLGKRICREFLSPDSLSPLVLEAMANELLVYTARNFVESDKPPGWLKQAHELLHDRCGEKVSVAEIAAAVGVHPLHLARTFRRFFNCSPGEYLRKCRIQQAANLLLGSKKTLAEIALISGFADQSQFTRSFRQYTGNTPANFRRVNKS
ncbi:MAG TPA: AraC family transcriptional regulator [Pyrinomonadaceae bacterium]